MNSWTVCYPKRLDSLMNIHTTVIMCMDPPSLRKLSIECLTIGRHLVNACWIQFCVSSIENVLEYR